MTDHSIKPDDGFDSYELDDGPDDDFDSYALEDPYPTTPTQRHCGKSRAIGVHKVTRRVEQWPMFCRKPACPNCGPRRTTPWYDALREYWGSLSRLHVMCAEGRGYGDEEDEEDEEIRRRIKDRVKDHRKRHPRDQVRYIVFVLTSGDWLIFSTAPLPGEKYPTESHEIAPTAALSLVRDLFDIETEPRLVKKPRGSRDWALPDPKPEPKRKRLFLGLPDKHYSQAEDALYQLLADRGLTIETAPEGTIGILSDVVVAQVRKETGERAWHDYPEDE